MGGMPKSGYKDISRLFLYLAFVLAVHSCSALDITECVSALGMESGAIKDHEINASSSYNEGSVGPQNARGYIGSPHMLPTGAKMESVVDYVTTDASLRHHWCQQIYTKFRYNLHQNANFRPNVY